MRTEDGYIVDKCLNGDSAAFALLVDKYKAAIYALAYSRLRNFHDAEDVTQEVFIKAYQRLRTLKRWDKFLAWLYAITYNLCKNFTRARSRRPDGEFIEDQDLKTLEEPSTDSYRDDLVCELIHEALDSLPEMYRQVLTLHYLGGMNSREIAEFLGMSPAAVRQRITRARSQLKEGILTMMNTTFGGQKLQASFTFRIVEAVKHMKIQTMPRATALPWGLSFAAGIIITMLSLSPHLRILNPSAIPAGSPLLVEAKALKAGEIPVDILKTSQILTIASKQGDGNSGEPDPQGMVAMAPQGEGETWAKKSDMPTARTLLSVSVVDGKIYAIGGRGLKGQNNWGDVSTTEEYDPATDTWTRKADMPTARRGLSTGVVNGKIYAIGGYIGANGFSSAVEEYDPATDTWEKKADLPGGSRAGAGLCTVDGKLYIVGGNAHGRPDTMMQEYDPDTDTWTRKADMPTGRELSAVGVVNGKIYAIGGRTRAGQNPIPLSIVEEYDPASDTWTEKTDMPTARYFFGVGVINGNIYVIGGDGGVGASTAVEEYVPATDIWTRRAKIPTGRWGLAAGIVDGRIYAIGGNDVLSVVEEYTPEGWKSSSLSPQGRLPTMWGEVKRVAAKLY